MPHDFLRFSQRIACLPVIHGSGDYAVEVRRLMLEEKFDCLAVPLPPSFQEPVEQAIGHLPQVTVVIQEESPRFTSGNWSPESGSSSEEEHRPCSYVPVDPCQPVIAALRIAFQERMPRAFIDLETERFQPLAAALPDPYALKRVAVEQFAGAVLPALPRLPEGQPLERAVAMAARLRELEQQYQSILFVCSLTDWPWIREAYIEQQPATAEDELVEDPQVYRVDYRTLIFLLGELPFITGLYERARVELDDDENLSVDGVKEMLLATRKRYQDDLGKRARKITPHMLRCYLRYVRNLSLIERRMTPDLYTLIVASQQIAGDQFAIHLAETARDYPFARPLVEPLPYDEFQMGVSQGRMPDGELVRMKSRLPGPPVTWRTCQLNRRPPKLDQMKWQMQWNPFRQCSWPPEDVAIERFRTHVKEHALKLLGQDLARTEKFSTSLKDGLDIRETLRNWHTGELYVKVFPPSRGSLDCVVMLFDSPADPRDYPWRITWHAEHHDESTLSFFATHYGQEIVGPGIAQATYGGAMFLFPPRGIPDVWRDRRFDYADTLEERLLAAALYHSEEPHVALLSDAPPGAGWRRLAKRHGKRLVHVPLAHFSQETVQQLRMFHVLNGQQVRSYAEHFIRKA
ncbi:MAG: hypothetical protein KDA75_11245 [Planctomycetaceae bacterium]|nr:hypothetical protein [Planctomycetaceae bacterium]